MERLTIGNVEIRPILDAAVLMNPHQMFTKHADEMLEQYSEYIIDDRGLMGLSITSFVLRSAGKTIMIDTGLGNRRRPGFPRGNLADALAEAGIAREDVDIIVHTHLHIDHVGWNTVDNDKGEPEIFFPNARYVIQQPEWDYWMTPERLAEEGNAHLRECVEPLRDTGRIDFHNGETALDENLTLIGTPGHTPGHVSVGIASAGERAIIIGDASHHPAQLDHPDWSPNPDVDPVLSAKTREKLFEEAAADGRTWIAGHWQFPGIGRIVPLEGKRVFQAL